MGLDREDLANKPHRGASPRRNRTWLHAPCDNRLEHTKVRVSTKSGAVQWRQPVDLPHDVSSDTFRVSERRARPSPEALSWALSSLGDGGKLVSVRPLVGGISSAVHGPIIEDRRGGRSRVVMRRWLEPETESLVKREAAALTGLAATGIPAPALVAADPSGDNAGRPALLMEWLPGQVDLAPRDPQRWLRAPAPVRGQLPEGARK